MQLAQPDFVCPRFFCKIFEAKMAEKKVEEKLPQVDMRVWHAKN